MSKDASRFVGSIPENYDHGLGPHIFADYAADLARRVAALAPEAVLELAAGTGIVTRHLRDALPGGCALVASDLNPPMLEVARNKFPDDDGVQFETVDATDLQFENETFDVVACQFGVMFFPDKARSYSEVARVLKPGGSYLFNVWGPLAENPFAEIAHETVRTFFPDDPPGFYQVPFGYHDVESIRQSVIDAGFQDVEADDVRFIAKIISPERFAKGLVFGNPLYEEVVNRGGEPEAVFEMVAAAIDDKLGGEMPLQAFVIHARS